MAQSIKATIGGLSGELLLPPQVKNLEVNAEFTTDTQVKVTGSFKNVPLAERNLLKKFQLNYKKNALPDSPTDGTIFEIADITSDVIRFTFNINGVAGGDIYGFRVFPVSKENVFQTSMGSNIQLLTLQSISKVLNDNSWDVISKVSAKDEGADYWKVGDCKQILLKGLIGTQNVNFKPWLFILGFNHNWETEGKGITFGTFKNALENGTDICLVDSHYNSDNTSGLLWFNINHSSNTSVGGWKDCDIRFDILGSCKAKKQQNAPEDTATNPVYNTFIACLPKDLRKVMKPMIKWTDNVGGMNGKGKPQNVTATIDYLPLMSEFEVFGALSKYANTYEKGHQKQYDYYANGNSNLKKRHNSQKVVCSWWLRSPDRQFGTMFCTNKKDYSERVAARTSYGLSPVLMV